MVTHVISLALERQRSSTTLPPLYSMSSESDWDTSGEVYCDGVLSVFRVSCFVTAGSTSLKFVVQDRQLLSSLLSRDFCVPLVAPSHLLPCSSPCTSFHPNPRLP